MSKKKQKQKKDRKQQEHFLKRPHDLPTDVTTWSLENIPDSELIYANELGGQVSFVRDVIAKVLMPNHESRENPVMVISTHHSKSVLLPVYQINLKNQGVTLIMRDNFYNWKVTVESAKPIECDFIGIFDPDHPKRDEIKLYCEGFPANKIFGSYNDDHSKFTVSFDNDYQLYTFAFILANYLNK